MSAIVATAVLAVADNVNAKTAIVKRRNNE